MDRAHLKPLIVLGATGSIGTQAIEVAAHLGIEVAGIAVRSGSEGLMSLATRMPEASIVVAEPTPSEREELSERFGRRVQFGPDALVEQAARSGSIVVNGIVGAAGLGASVAALEAGNRLALANKESLVAGGPVVESVRKRSGGELIPVDSEHSALFQCLVGEDPSEVRRLVLTASGGPFRGYSAEELEQVTLADALRHPTWDMGPRITIDSATLMNKALEVIEAHFLFGFDFDRIDVLVHPQSIVHSLVEFVDGSLKAHVGEPDMRVPIQYALTYPHRAEGVVSAFDLTGSPLDFEKPDREAFPLLGLGYEVGREGGSAPAVFNAADEIAVQAFRDGRIGFTAISHVIQAVLDKASFRPVDTVADVIEADAEARSLASELVSVC